MIIINVNHKWYRTEIIYGKTNKHGPGYSLYSEMRLIEKIDSRVRDIADIIIDTKEWEILKQKRAHPEVDLELIKFMFWSNEHKMKEFSLKRHIAGQVAEVNKIREQIGFYYGE